MSDAVTTEQVASLAQRLDAFAKTLPERERDILAHVLSTASPDDAETEGFHHHNHGEWGSPSGSAISVIIGPQMNVPVGSSQTYFADEAVLWGDYSFPT